MKRLRLAHFVITALVAMSVVGIALCVPSEAKAQVVGSSAVRFPLQAPQSAHPTVAYTFRDATGFGLTYESGYATLYGGTNANYIALKVGDISMASSSGAGPITINGGLKYTASSNVGVWVDDVDGLYFTGVAAASLPGTCQNGALQWDTTNHQLRLCYSNGWRVITDNSTSTGPNMQSFGATAPNGLGTDNQILLGGGVTRSAFTTAVVICGFQTDGTAPGAITWAILTDGTSRGTCTTGCAGSGAPVTCTASLSGAGNGSVVVVKKTTDTCTGDPTGIIHCDVQLSQDAT